MNYSSPVGNLLLTRSDNALTGIYFQGDMDSDQEGEAGVEASQDASVDLEPFSEVIQQLDEYFAGHRQAFHLERLVLQPQGTAFQLRVWRELLRIPYGQTVSYGELASRIGQPTASRAVGLANGRNPISIVIPCHRVIGAKGQLIGYGGGLDRKLFLLKIESLANRVNAIGTSVYP